MFHLLLKVYDVIPNVIMRVIVFSTAIFASKDEYISAN